MGDDAPIGVSGGTKKKKDDKHRRRDPRSWDNIKKSSMTMTEEERDTYMSKMYMEMYNENRTLFLNLQAREKQVSVMQKDSDKERSELTKSIVARGQLESLCRELQKQNKLIKEENVARIKEEEDRRREVANTFTERLNALTNLITESKDKSNKVKEENQNMTEKLTELYEQYQKRENHLETVTKQLDLQKKLAETQAKKTEIEHEAEHQTYLAEKKALLLQLEQYEREMVLLQEKNRSLEAQVDLYKSQYSDFETTMTKSNKVFDTFKEEMSRMNKQLHTLERERNDLRKRWQSSVNSLIVLSEQHVALSNEQSALEKRLVMLQKLCRQLQEDRSAFLKQLKENNIEPVVPTVKNTDTSESDAPQINGSLKSAERAGKLKQQLGKTQEVVKMIDPIMDDDEMSLEEIDKISEEKVSSEIREKRPCTADSGRTRDTDLSSFEYSETGDSDPQQRPCTAESTHTRDTDLSSEMAETGDLEMPIEPPIGMHIEQPVEKVKVLPIKQPLIMPIEQPIVGMPIEQPLIGMPMEQPIIGMSMEQPLIGIPIEECMLMPIERPMGLSSGMPLGQPIELPDRPWSARSSIVQDADLSMGCSESSEINTEQRPLGFKDGEIIDLTLSSDSSLEMKLSVTSISLSSDGNELEERKQPSSPQK